MAFAKTAGFVGVCGERVTMAENVERMNIYLPSDLAGKVHEAVRSGEFGMHCDVVRYAIENWLSQRGEQKPTVEG